MFNGLFRSSESTSGHQTELDAIASALLYLVVAVVPLAVFPSALDQSFAIKYLLLKVVVLVLVGLFVAKLLIEGAKIKLTGLEFPAIVLLILILISTRQSVHLPTSLNGAYLRYDGLYSYLIYVGLFFFAVQFLSQRERLENFLKLGVVAAWLVAVYGTFQYFGIDFMPWGSTGFNTGRSFSTLGNPVTLGAYLALMLPIALGLMLEAKEPAEKVPFAIATFAIALCLVVTLSRSAWLAAAIGLAVVGIIGVRRGGANIRTMVLTGTAVLVLALLALVLLGPPTLVSKFTEVVSGGGSVYTRLLMWQISLKLIAERPVFGFGPDALGLVFSRYEPLALAKMAPLEIQDNVHNAFLQLAATSGVPALLVFLALIALLLTKAIKRINTGQVSFMEIGLLGGIVAFLIASITNVTGIASSTFLWLIMGALAASWAYEAKVITPLNNIVKYSVLLLIVPAVLLATSVSVRPFLKEIALAQARVSEKSGDVVEAEKQYNNAIEYSPADSKAYRELGIMLADTGARSQSASIWLKGLSNLDRAVKVSPNDHINQLLLGQAYLYGARSFDKAFYKKAEETLDKALELRPYSFYANGMLGAIYLETDRLDKAYEKLALATSINANDPQARYYLGRYYEESGQTKQALAEYKKVLTIDPKHDRAKQAAERLSNSANQ